MPLAARPLAVALLPLLLASVLPLALLPLLRLQDGWLPLLRAVAFEPVPSLPLPVEAAGQ